MGSGKGEAAEFFKKKGFAYVSLSDALREEIARRGLQVNRITMQDVGNQLRCKEGAAALAERVRKKIITANHCCWVIDGIRNPAEVEELKREERFYLVAITATEDLLVERLAKRGRQTDQLSREEILQALRRERGEDQEEYGPQEEKCIQLADFVVDNNSTLENFYCRLQEILKKMEKNNET